MGKKIPAFAEIDLDVPEELRPSALRSMGMTPPLDRKIDQLATPTGSFWRKAAVLTLRTYRQIRPPAIGNRCVFEPSCSRYSELAFRTRSLPDALRLTAGRLHRCRPGKGGLDLTELEIPQE